MDRRRIALVASVFAAVAPFAARSQEPPASPAPAAAAPGGVTPTSFDDGKLDAYYIGHSLMSDVPDMVACFVAARAADGHAGFRFAEQFRLGGSLVLQWEESFAEPAKRTPQPARHRAYWFDALPKGGFDALVMIDSVPRGGSDMMRETLQFADNFVGVARTGSPGVRVFFYEPWHCVMTGTPQGCMYDKQEHRKLRWRARVDADAPAWDGVVAGLRTAYPDLVVGLIPGARGLAALHDEIGKGTVPGWTAVEKDAFDDDIHLNPYGKYFIACLHYAALYGRSPVGLPVEVADRDGTSYWNVPNWQKKTYAPPSPELARRLQEIAWTAMQPFLTTPAPAKSK